MGGGADYQAEAYAFVSAKILAEEALNWVETGCDRVPAFVRMETGSGGDDLLISLRQNNKVELQAKKGLQRGDDLWDALMGLAHAVHKDANTYGVLLTNTDASGTVREELKSDIEKIAANFNEYNKLSSIAQEFVSHLKADSIDPQVVCKRLFVRVWNFEPGSQGEESTLSAIRKVIAQPEQAGSARSVLVSDGMDHITLRGGRDAVTLARLLQQNGIALSRTAQNMLVAREAYLRWCVECNATFFIPSLLQPLPMEKAWVRLRTMGSKSKASGGASLEEQIRSYHEWHRLAETNARYDSIAIEMAAREHRLLVVVAGPGAGKSTLMRRLARAWAQENKLLLCVSLKRVSKLIDQGMTFDHAVRDTALDTFGCNPASRPHLLQTANYLLADGLDETDPNRERIAGHLRHWALADKNRHVIVTTRPIGHNPAWFADWEHVELLPFEEHDVQEFAATVLAQLSATANGNAALNAYDFLNGLKQSQAARLASRNPLLLGFLLALYVQGEELGRNRYRLFASILNRIGRQSRDDRPYQYHMNEAEARRAIDCMGWLLMRRSTILDEELKRELGKLLAESFGLNEFQGEAKAQEALAFWEERGLLEAVGVGVQRTYTFVYMTFQEFAAARYLERLPQNEFIHWVEQHYMRPRYRETLLLTGGTAKAEACIETLLNADIPDDPVSTAGLLAAETLAEMEHAPEVLRQRVVDLLTQRLTSQVPHVAYEAGDRLIPFAPAAPTLIGSLAHSLSTHEQAWTREVACALGLLAGSEYINEQSLVAVYPKANDSRMGSGRGGGMSLNYDSISRKLILRGTEYLLRAEAPQEHIEVVKHKYFVANHSGGVHEELEEMLRTRISAAEFEAIPPHYEHDIAFWVEQGIGDAESLREEYKKKHAPPDFSVIDRALREAEIAFLQATILASNSFKKAPSVLKPASPMGTIAAIEWILDMGGSSLQEIYILRQKLLEAELVEVLRGIILIGALDPVQLKAEAEQILSKMVSFNQHIWQSTKGTVEDISGRDIEWSLADNSELDAELLGRALSHPSLFVCQSAALLLDKCFDKSVKRRQFTEALATNSAHALRILGQNAKDIWQENAAEMVCARLEQNMTPECAPLVKGLEVICDPSFSERTTAISRQALSSTDVEMVEAGLSAMQELALNLPLHNTVQERYSWWLHEGPQEADDSGTYPYNAADMLLAYLITQNNVQNTELFEAVTSKHSDVQRVAIKELCHRMASDDALATKILDDVFNRKMPIELLDTLSQSQPNVCKKYFEHIAAFLNSDNRRMQEAGVRALGDGWAEYSFAEKKLRPLFDSEDVSLRNEAVASLRRLQTQKNMNEQTH